MIDANKLFDVRHTVTIVTNPINQPHLIPVKPPDTLFFIFRLIPNATDARVNSILIENDFHFHNKIYLCPFWLSNVDGCFLRAAQKAPPMTGPMRH